MGTSMCYVSRFWGFLTPHSPLSSKVSIGHDPSLVLRKVFFCAYVIHGCSLYNQQEVDDLNSEQEDNSLLPRTNKTKSNEVPAQDAEGKKQYNCTHPKKDKLKRHFDVMHGKDKKHKCSKCDFGTNSIMKLTRHITIFHEKNKAEANGSGNGSAQNGEESAGDRKQKNKDSVSKKAKLDEDDNGIVCLDDDIVEVEEGQSPAKKAELAAATGGKKPYECSICNTSFAYKSWLKKHTESVHERKKPHNCSFCDKSFYEKSKLKKHIQTVHKGKQLDEDDDGIVCLCSKCDFVTSSIMKLTQHYNILHEKNGAEANGSGNGSAQNGEESAGDQKRKNKIDSVSKRAKLDEDDDDIVCLNDDVVEVEEGQSPAKKAELPAATGGATVAKPVTKEDSELMCMDWSYLETQGAKRRVGPPRVPTTNTEPKPNVNLKQGSDKPT